MRKIRKKAVIIENTYQFGHIKQLFVTNGYQFYANRGNVEFPFYGMLYETDAGIFMVPNKTLKGTETGIIEQDFEPITMNQIKNIIKEEKGTDKCEQK